MKESPWTREICAQLKRQNCMTFAVVAHKLQEPGWPDRYVHHAYWRGWLEFKGPKTRTAPKQKIIIRELNVRRPWSAFIVRAPDRIEDHSGNVIAYFDGTGRDLLHTLKGISDGS